jgi:YHS domain-containing protein
MNSTATPNRDPVCGMSVDPATAKYSHVHEGTAWYFCADNCRQQFIAHPDLFLKTKKDEIKPASPRKVSWTREVLMSAAVFAAVVMVIIAARGFAKKVVSVEPGSKITGAAAGQHQAVDGGQGSIITNATHEQNTSDLEFTVSLNTHTVDLTDFDPSKQIRLRVAGQEYSPQTATGTGERSSHHQNYRLGFPPVNDRNVALVVHNVGGIEQRELPFRL